MNIKKELKGRTSISSIQQMIYISPDFTIFVGLQLLVLSRRNKRLMLKRSQLVFQTAYSTTNEAWKMFWLCWTCTSILVKSGSQVFSCFPFPFYTLASMQHIMYPQIDKKLSQHVLSGSIVIMYLKYFAHYLGRLRIMSRETEKSWDQRQSCSICIA